MSTNTNQPQQPVNIISTAHGKDKVIDIRDGLWLPKNYGEITDGGIPLFLCDYSKGTGDKSVTVKATLEPFRFKIMKEIVVKNLGTLVIPAGGNGIPEQIVLPVTAMFMVMDTFVKDVTKTIAGVVKGELKDRNQILCSVGKAFKDSKAFFKGTSALDIRQTLCYDYSYNQERVNPHKEHDGICPVSSLIINRNGMRNGEPSRYPWFIKITNFDAKKRQDNGKISYDPKTRTNIREAFINVSDDDMYRICDDAEQFVDIWSCSNSVKLVRDAMVQKAQAQAMNNR